MTKNSARVYTFALLAGNVLNFMRIKLCDILYNGIVYIATIPIHTFAA